MIKNLLPILSIPLFVACSCNSTQLTSRMDELNRNQAITNENISVLRTELSEIWNREVRKNCNLRREGHTYVVPMTSSFECKHIAIVLQSILQEIEQEQRQQPQDNNNTEHTTDTNWHN